MRQVSSRNAKHTWIVKYLNSSGSSTSHTCWLIGSDHYRVETRPQISQCIGRFYSGSTGNRLSAIVPGEGIVRECTSTNVSNISGYRTIVSPCITRSVVGSSQCYVRCISICCYRHLNRIGATSCSSVGSYYEVVTRRNRSVRIRSRLRRICIVEEFEGISSGSCWCTVYGHTSYFDLSG